VKTVPRRVLLVDDEAPLLHLLEDFLTRSGYEVEAYEEPLRALERFGAHPAWFPLVIADVTMPDLSGLDLVRRLAELSSEVQMLLLSGLPLSTEPLPEQLRQRVSFLQKPFVPRMLLESVRELEARMARAQTASDSAC
jgi:DNA-binding response OmpR family regulator